MQQPPRVRFLARGQGKRVMEAVLPTTYKATGAETGGGFGLVEHLVPPRSLGAPPHRHRHEDEYSYILEGQVGVEIGDQTLLLGPGDFVCKPRGIMHTFWNPGSEPARLLEIISPAGFEHYFEELNACFRPDGSADAACLMPIRAKYGLEFDPGRVPELMARHGLGPGRP